MKKFPKLTALALAGVLALSLVACAPTGAKPSTAPTTSPDPSTLSNFTVGICQLAPHPALDAATKGFQDALNEGLPNQVDFILNNAAGDTPTCGTIVGGFVANGVDLILANASASLVAAASATGDIPVLGTSVTEYGVALGIQDFSGTVGTNVSGTSDLAPLDEQAAMVKEWFPDAKNVGLLYCSAEPNSQYQVDVITAELTKLGYTCTAYPFSDSNDLSAVTQTACATNDIIYVPTDNTAASNAGIIDNICRGYKIPVFTGEEGSARVCGVATLSIDYYDLGFATGKMAVKILKGESDIATMPIEYAPQFTKKYNAAICADLGITPPAGYEAITAN